MKGPKANNHATVPIHVARGGRLRFCRRRERESLMRGERREGDRRVSIPLAFVEFNSDIKPYPKSPHPHSLALVLTQFIPHVAK